MCDVMKYGNGVVCFLSIFMAITVNCCWYHLRCFIIHQTLTLLMLLLTASSAAALTMDFILWCESIKKGPTGTCESATNGSDTLYLYFNKMTIEQGCEWATIPLLLTAVIFYSAIMRNHQGGYSPLTDPGPDARAADGPSWSGRYYDSGAESAPLVHSRAAESSFTVDQAGSRAACYASENHDHLVDRGGVDPARRRPPSRGSSGRRSRSVHYEDGSGDDLGNRITSSQVALRVKEVVQGPRPALRQAEPQRDWNPSAVTGNGVYNNGYVPTTSVQVRINDTPTASSLLLIPHHNQ